MTSSNFTNDDWIDCLNLSLKLPVSLPRRAKREYSDDTLPRSAKRRETAISIIKQDIVKLRDELQVLIIERAKTKIDDPNYPLPIHFRTRINKLKQRIWRKKFTLKRYEQGYKVADKIPYQQGVFSFSDDELDQLTWLQGIINDLYHKWKRFSTDDGKILSTTYKGKPLPPNHALQWRRLVHLHDNLTQAGTFLEIQDGRWIIRYLDSVICHVKSNKMRITKTIAKNHSIRSIDINFCTTHWMKFRT